ncbi:MAG: OsmC family protein [Nitrospinota bacterium]
MKVTAKHIEGFRFEMVSDSLTIISDQAEQYGGEGTGPMPSELLLWSLASCLGQSIAYIAKKKRVEIRNLKLEAQGKKDMDDFRYGEIGVLVSGDLPSDELNKMLELARKYCFVSNTLAQGITVDYKVE